MAFVRRKDEWMPAKEARIKGKQPHLADLFSTGKIVTVVYPDFPEVEVWVTRPTTQQNQNAQKAARVIRARRYTELTDENSDEAKATELQVNEMTKDELVDALVAREQRNYQTQAYNEVLYAEPEQGIGEEEERTRYGRYWGPEGSQYLEILDAQIQRLEEIREHNIEQEAGGGTDIINAVEDEEMVRLNKVTAEFDKQASARVEELVQDERSQVARKPIDKLRRELLSMLIDTECDMLWFETYKNQMLYYAVRYPDDHRQLYFQDVDQLLDLPQVIQMQLHRELDEIDAGAEQTKNLLTPLLS